MSDGTPRVRHVPDTAEGDVNLSPLRRAWERDHVRGSTRALLDRDADAYLHQSLSTPCFDALVEAEGIWLTDADGRRFMDFHGNNVHQVGYRHPRVIDAVKRQLDTLPFSPRRFTNSYAVELAEKLGALAPGPLGKVLFAPGGTLAPQYQSPSDPTFFQYPNGTITTDPFLFLFLLLA